MPTHVLIIYPTSGHFHQTSAIPRRAHELHYVQCSGIKDVPLPRWLNEEGMCVREREDLVLREALGNYPQMHVLFSHKKLWMIAMRLLI